MLFAITGLQRCPVEGIDGRVGTVKDFLFDDQSWKICWMVLDIGHWCASICASRSLSYRART